MNLIKKITNILFGKTIIIQDSFFGEMTDVDSHYECRRTFRPLSKIVEIGVAKKTIGASNQQVVFFQWIEDNYDKIIQKITPLLEKSISEGIPNYQIKDFKKEFDLEYLYIPTCEEEIKKWEISFYADNALQHSCSFEMKGLGVKKLLIDG